MANEQQPVVQSRQDVWREMGAQKYNSPEDFPTAANQEPTYDAQQNVGVIDAFIKGVPSSKDSSFANYDPTYQPTIGETVASSLTDFARSGAKVLAEWTPEYKAARSGLGTLRKTDPEAADQIEASTIGAKLSGFELATKGGAALGEGVLTVMPFFKVGRTALAVGEAASLSKFGKAGEVIAKSPLASKLYSGGLGGFLYGGLYGLHTQDGDWEAGAKSAAMGTVFGVGMMGSISGLAFAGKYGGNKTLQVFKFGKDGTGNLASNIVSKYGDTMPIKLATTIGNAVQSGYETVFMSVGERMKKYYGDVGENFVNMYRKASRIATQDLGKLQLAFIDNGLMEAPTGLGKAFKGVEFIGNDTERMLTYNQILRGQGAYADPVARAAAIQADPKLQFLDGLRKYYATTAQREGVTETLLNPDTYLPKHTPVVELTTKTRTALDAATTQAEREAIYAANDPMVKEMVDNSVQYEKAFGSLDEAYGTYYDYADVVNGGSHTPMGDNKMLQRMVNSGQAKTLEEARGKIISDLRLRKQSLTPLAASLDFERQVDLPWYDPNPSRVMPQYVFDASMRIEMSKTFGVNDEVLHEMIGSIKADLSRGIKADEAAKAFEDFVRTVTGQVNSSPSAEKISSTLRALQVTKLAFAQVINLGQSLNTLLASDLGSTMHGLTTAFTAPEIRNAIERGVLTNQFLRQIFEYSSGGSQVADKFLKYTGFTYTEMFNRAVGSTVADMWGEKNLQKLLGDYGLGKKVPVVSPPIANERFTGLVDHIKNNGGITVGFDGKIIDKGFAFSILDKADEVRMKVGDSSFKENFIKTFNSLKERYGSEEGAHFGGWVDGEDFVVDVTKVGDDMLQSVYDGIIKKQDAIGDLGKYAATSGQEGTIYLSKEVIGSIQPISGASLRSAGSSFGSWEEVVSYYSGKDFKNSVNYGELLKSEAVNHSYIDKMQNIGTAGAGAESKSGQVSKGAVSGTTDRQAIIEKIKADSPREYFTLQELGIPVDDVIARGYMTQEEKAIAAQTFVERTQFLGRPIDLPYFASSPGGKVIAQFKTFAYQQARFIVKEMKDGFRKNGQGTRDWNRTFRNIFILSTVFPMTGEVLADVRSLITQDKRPTGAFDRYVSDIFAAGTYGMLYDFWRSAQTGSTADNILGTTAGDVVRYFENLAQAPGQIMGGHGDTALKNFTKNILRQTGVGRPIVNVIYPSTQPGRTTLQSLNDWAAD